MSSRAILGLASIGGLVVSMALPAFAQTTTTQPTTTTPSTTTTNSSTTTTTPNCPPSTAATGANTSTNNPNGTTPSGAGATGNGNEPSTGNPNAVGASTEGAKGNTTNGTGPGITAKPNTTTSSTTTANCTNAAPTGTMQNAPATEPMESTTTNYNALTNNPNGSDWLAKFNRPNVRSNNYLGTTTRPSSMNRTMHGTMQRCRYVMERGVRTKICK